MAISYMKGPGKTTIQTAKENTNFSKTTGGTKGSFKKEIFMDKDQLNLMIKWCTRETFRISSSESSSQRPHKSNKNTHYVQKYYTRRYLLRLGTSNGIVSLRWTIKL